MHQDELVHISQMADRFVKDPREVVSAGDRVDVRVLEVKLDRQQIALSMKSGAEVARAPGDRSSGSTDDRSGGRQHPHAPRPTPPPNKAFFNSPFAGLDELRGK